jgi:CubicO group peptidase (beta-lactamase class C family)
MRLKSDSGGNGRPLRRLSTANPLLFRFRPHRLVEAVSGTLGDYARFAQMLLNEGELDGEAVLRWSATVPNGGVWNGPGSAAHHQVVLRCARDKRKATVTPCGH